MTFEMIYEAACNVAEKHGASVREVSVPKANGIFRGIEIRMPGASTALVFYPENFGEDDSMEKVERFIEDAFEEGSPSVVYDMLRWEWAKDRVYTAVVNYELNAEFLKNKPHYRLFNLAVYAVINSENSYEVAVDHGLLEKYGIGKDELFKRAAENRRNGMELYRLSDLVMHNWVPVTKPIRNAGEPFALTSVNIHRGAALIADSEAMRESYRIIGKSFYICPSSVHELILIPDGSGLGIEDILKTVRCVNDTVVDGGEKLADSVYRFDGEELKLAV